MISKNTIDQVYETARVEEVIGDFVGLKKSGTNFKGLSPFTQERSPSFMVSPVKQIWKDFSSGKGGNVVAFLIEDESPKKVLRLFKYFIRQVREKYPSTPIVFIEITPTPSRWKQWNAIEKVNRLVEELCARKEGLYFVSTASAFLAEDNKPNDSLFISDRLHLNSKGYTVWNRLIKKELKRIKKANSL